MLPIVPVHAQTRSGTEGSGGAERYNQCLDTATRDPEAAMSEGAAWFAAGGGIPARHCMAVAMIGLRQFDEAAARLERLAAEMDEADTGLRLGLLTQAAQAWLLSGRAERAAHLQGLALRLRPDDPGLRIDRALSLITLGRSWDAIDDLNAALAVDPDNAEAYLYRASAYRYLDVLELARDDADRAVALEPGRPEAWLERGILRQLAGDLKGARADWLEASERDPDGPAGGAARYRLQEMDLTWR